MINKIFKLLIFSIITPFLTYSQIVEITGQVVIEGTNEPLAGVVVSVKDTEHGIIANSNGMFSIVIDKNESLVFEGLGFKTAQYSLPQNFDSKYLTIVQQMKVDTFHLNEVIINNLMTPEEFDFAFKYKYLPDELLLASRQNMSPEAQMVLMQSLQRNGSEVQAYQQMNYQMQYGNNYGQQQQYSGINPFALGTFFDSWKKGNFKGNKKK